MTMTEVQLALLTRALATLERRPNFAHGKALIQRIAGPKAAAAIARLERELLTANSQAKGAVSQLSTDSQAYWKAIQDVMRLGQIAQASGDRNLEKRASLKSERLEERFDESVPDCDKPKFLQSKGDEKTWDERWSYLEFRPPLLRREYVGGVVSYPANVAQRMVLSELLDQGQPEQDVERARARAKSLIRLARAAE